MSFLHWQKCGFPFCGVYTQRFLSFEMKLCLEESIVKAHGPKG